MMQQNNPVAVVMEYMRGGADIKAALAQAAQQHPEMFPQQKVNMALAVLGKPQANRQQMIANMAKERGIDLQEYMGRIKQNLR